MSEEDFTKTVTINPEIISQLQQVERTFYQLSVKYTNLGMEMRSIEANISDLNTHKNNLMASLVKESGFEFDPTKYSYDLTIQDGEPKLVIHPRE